jgi:hypothetical protein
VAKTFLAPKFCENRFLKKIGSARAGVGSVTKKSAFIRALLRYSQSGRRRAVRIFINSQLELIRLNSKSILVIHKMAANSRRFLVFIINHYNKFFKKMPAGRSGGSAKKHAAGFLRRVYNKD